MKGRSMNLVRVCFMIIPFMLSSLSADDSDPPVSQEDLSVDLEHGSPLGEGKYEYHGNDYSKGYYYRGRYYHGSDGYYDKYYYQYRRVDVYYSGRYLVLDDGTGWIVYPNDAYVARGWNWADDVWVEEMIEENEEEYPHKLHRGNQMVRAKKNG